jgi:hypothetical protein
MTIINESLCSAIETILVAWRNTNAMFAASVAGLFAGDVEDALLAGVERAFYTRIDLAAAQMLTSAEMDALVPAEENDMAMAGIRVLAAYRAGQIQDVAH